ncbi:MAG: MBL fold metallo-hydrolase [Ferruginibacter sp.]
MNISFQWIGGATFILNVGDLKIACDPVLCEKGTVQDYFWFKSKRLEEPIYETTTFNNIDLWLITHNHEDHLDTIGLSTIHSNCTVVSNGNASTVLKKSGISDLTILDWYNTKQFSINGYTIKVEAIPAIHGVNPVSAFFAGKVNGYYLTISKGEEIFNCYITGDTVYKNKVIQALKGKAIDLLVANMGAAKAGSWIMTLTLNASMLKKMIQVLQPKMVIPVHYGTFEHYKEPITKIEAINDERIKFVKLGSTIVLH